MEKSGQQKETARARDTHSLGSAEGEADQNTESKLASEGHSLPGERRGRDQSGRQPEESEQRMGTHSLECAEREREIRIPKESEQAEGHLQTGE